MTPEMMIRKLKAHSEKIRYTVVGAWNTVFGLSVFALLYWLFSKAVNYLLILLVSNVITITNAYVCYKFLVFRTKGNYLREYLRFYLIYGASFLVNIALMFILVSYLEMNAVASQGIILCFIFACSYFGHKYFSFKTGMPRSRELEG